MPPVIEVHQLFKVAVDNGNRVIEIEPVFMKLMIESLKTPLSICK